MKRDTFHTGKSSQVFHVRQVQAWTCAARAGCAAGLSPPTSRLRLSMRLRGVRERRAASAMASAPERGGARKLPVLDTVVTRRFRVRLSHSPRGHTPSGACSACAPRSVDGTTDRRTTTSQDFSLYNVPHSCESNFI